MARKLKRKIKRGINRTRKLICTAAGASLFAALYLGGDLPGLHFVQANPTENSVDKVIDNSYENLVSSRRMTKRPFFAHRGFSSQAMENSLSAFDLAVAQGYEQLEMDLWKSSDGVIYVCHDNSLKASAGIDKKITDTDSTQLDKTYLKNGEKLPRLSEVFEDLQTDAIYLLELKQGSAEVPQITEILNQYKSLQRNICVQAWDLETLKAIENEFPYMFTMLLMSNLTLLEDALLDESLSGLAIEESQLNPEIIERIHQADKQVWAWTVNKKGRMNELISIGVDGLISDHPDQVVEAFQEF